MGIQINGQTDTVTTTTAGGRVTVTPASFPSVSSLNVSGVSTFSGGVIVSAGTTAAPSISPSGDSNTGIYFPAADTVCIAEGGAEVIRVNSSGNVGINSTAPRTALDVGGTIFVGRVDSSQEGGEIAFCRSSDNASSWSVDVYGSTSTPSLRFIDNIAGASRMSLDNSGNLTVSSGNIVIGTSGRGIDFSATANSSGTMTSELLSDYEEGTFTPTIAGSPSYSAQVGRYTKVGNLVSFTIYISVSSTPSSSDLAVSGLPFTSVNVSNNYYSFQGWTNNWSSGANSIQWLFAQNSTTISAYSIPASGTISVVNSNSMGSIGNFIITGHYYTAS